MGTEVLRSTSQAHRPGPAIAPGALAAAVVAVGLAAWGVLVDVIGSVEHPLGQVFLIGGNAPGPWVIGGFVVGAVAARSGASMWTGMAWSVGALVVADTLYYLGQVAAGIRTGADAIVSAGIAWGFIAVAVGTAMGGAGALWARPERHGPGNGAVALGVLGAVLVAEAAFVLPREIGVAHLGRATYALLDVAIAVALVRLVTPGSRTRYVQTVALLGIAGAAASASILQMINSAIY